MILQRKPTRLLQDPLFVAVAVVIAVFGGVKRIDAETMAGHTAEHAAHEGILFAAEMLRREASRFIVTEGDIDGRFARDLWLGTYDTSVGDVVILPPDGYDGDPSVLGLVDALLDAHRHTRSMLCSVDLGLPSIDRHGSLRQKPISVSGKGWHGPHFWLEYTLRPGRPSVRVTSRGVQGDRIRTAEMTFSLDKIIDFTLVSPSRVMIGKNVLIEGTVGARYGVVAGELEDTGDDPLVMRSDFRDLSVRLDAVLDTLVAEIVRSDVDADNRLRLDHPVESQGLAALPELQDHDGDGAVDDFDVFLSHFDTNGDARVIYDSMLAGGLPVEFREVDDRIAPLIDFARPDRDGDGQITKDDSALGYADGALDVLDTYAKVRGGLAFAVDRDMWDLVGPGYHAAVHGSIRGPDLDPAHVRFDVGERELLEITTGMFASVFTWFRREALTGEPFGTYDPDAGAWSGQVGTQLSRGAEYEPASGTAWESIPYASPSAYDFYQRAVFRDMTFTNARIPIGTNALFERCTFVGVTYIETVEDCSHVNWNYAGAREADGSQRFSPPLTAELSDGTAVPETRLLSNNIRFHGCTFLGSVSGDTPGEYTHWRNLVQFTGVTRFYIDPDSGDLAAQPDAAELRAQLIAIDPRERRELATSSIFLPGWAVHIRNAVEPPSDPGQTPRTTLTGSIVTGLIETRGAIDVNGALLMTFRSTEGEGPLHYGGDTSAFMSTLGHFWPDDGDPFLTPTHPDFRGFGAITLRHDSRARLPDGLPWRLSVRSGDTSRPPAASRPSPRTR